MKLVIVTGMSGAGKTTVLKILEDLGYYCVDNLPPLLINKFSEVFLEPGAGTDKVALGIDVRGGKLFDGLMPELERMDAQLCPRTIIFMDCSDEVLVKRFKETRRSHPLVKDGDGRIIDGITRERELLNDIKQQATCIIDTSRILTRELRERVTEIITGGGSGSLMITVLSFGFKHGIPTDSDLVFDVRFVPNPFYVTGLKYKNGNDKEVSDFVVNRELSRVFLEKAGDLLNFLIPNYINEGKNQLVISIGCTGGQHRSVALANQVYGRLKESGCSVNIIHRDMKISQ